MFSLEGPARRPSQNRALAAYLSIIAGYVNSAGFLRIGSFTSHVTGTAGRFANDIVARDGPAAVAAFLLVVAFFLGAFTANTVLFTDSPTRRQRRYAILLTLEAALLVTFIGLAEMPLNLSVVRHADFRASLLCFALGMQNSLVTVISDARVRTTHLTGVVTDLGIEAARWTRWFLSRSAVRPVGHTAWLLLTILFGFLAGAVVGAEATTLFADSALFIPAAGALACAGYAAWSGRATR